MTPQGPGRIGVPRDRIELSTHGFSEIPVWQSALSSDHSLPAKDSGFSEEIPPWPTAKTTTTAQ